MFGGVEHHAPEVAAAADMDAPDRAGRRAQFLQHAQRAQAVQRGFGKAEVAFVEHRGQRAGGRGFHQGHVAADAVQRNGEAGAYQAAADDRDVVSGGLHAGDDRAGGTGGVC